MTKEDLDTKQNIINVTIDLIREEMDVNKITIRHIAKRAGVATSMINYHYQTKENLIDKAVQTFISTVIRKSDDKFKNMHLTPVDRLKGRLKQAAKFLAANPGVSRVSILSDLGNGNDIDNSSQSLQSILEQLKVIYGNKKDEIDLKFMAQQLLATLQVIFLRASVFKKQTGIDYFNDFQRDELMDKMVDNILGGKK